MVMTTKVAPTQMAASAMPAIPGRTSGASTPAAMTRCEPIQTLRVPKRRASGAAARVEAAAAAPNTGQVQPNSAGSPSASRAMAGRKVAGMM